MFDNLSSKLTTAMRTLKGNGRITDINVAATVKEIRRALMDADVNYKVAKEITDRIKDQAMGQKILIAVEPGQLLTKIVHDELTQLMGGQKQDINLKGDPAVVLIAGLQGSGKTTFSGKLAQYIKKGGRNVLLVACDIYRPAAIDQLKVLGEQVGVEVYAEPENKSAVSIAENALSYARKMGKKVVIVDTAGRLAVDEVMMTEIDSRGGAALSIRQIVDKPIKFISTGEKMEALDQFYPDRMANRILGMGDVLSLVERAQQAFDEDEAARLNKKIRSNNFTFEDFYAQLQQIKKMGNIKDLMGMVPGMSKAVKDVDISNDSFKPIEAIINSMTAKERQNPDILNPSRKNRIVAGSGTSIQEVNNLLKQFEDMRKMMKMMNKVQDGKMKMPNLGGMLKR